MTTSSAGGGQLRLATAFALAALTAGCASHQTYRNPNDPWEGFNRVVYQFNDDLDTVLLKPVEPTVLLAEIALVSGTSAEGSGA